MPTVGEARGTLREAVATAQQALTSEEGNTEPARQLAQASAQALQRFETANQGRAEGDEALEPAAIPASQRGGAGAAGRVGGEAAAADPGGTGAAGPKGNRKGNKKNEAHYLLMAHRGSPSPAVG